MNGSRFSAGRPSEFAISGHEFVEREPAIASTRIGEDPCARTAKQFRLPAPFDGRSAGDGAVGALAQERDKAWLIGRDFRRKGGGCGGEFAERNLVGARRRTGNDGRQPAAFVEQQPVVGRREQPGRKPRPEEYRPETIATAEKVMTGGRGAEARVEPAEHHVEIIRQNIG